MSRDVEFLTPESMMRPIGPYSHVAKANGLIMVSAIAGVDPATGDLARGGVAAETSAIIRQLAMALDAAGSDLARVLHVTVFMKDIAEFAEMNAAYEGGFGVSRPARSVVEVSDLPKPGALLTMNAMAVV